METFDFVNPTRVIFGAGSVERVGAEAKGLGQKALLVVGKGHASRSGLIDRVGALLAGEGIGLTHLGGIDPNPRLHSVVEGIRLCKENSVDFVIGLGGGSVMDISKVIAAGVYYEGDPWDMIHHGQEPYVPPERALPTLMVPTLAATGSEMNGNAVITNMETLEKSYVSEVCLYPRLSIVDPVLTCSVPPDQTAYGAADIIAHVIEAYFNGADDTPLQDRIQEGIILTVMENASKAIEYPDDLSARANLQWASVVALNGWAHAGSENAFPIHAIEHALSAHYDIAHGAGLAIVMPAWMKATCETRVEKYIQFAERVYGVDPRGMSESAVVGEGIERFETFLGSIGSPIRLKDEGIPAERLDRISDDVIRVSGDKRGRLSGRPTLDRDGVRRVYELAR